MNGRFKNLNLNTTAQELVDAGYTLVKESRWSLRYKKDNHAITFSKLLHGGFDWEYLYVTTPDCLDKIEKLDAAFSIYGEHLNPKVPEVWRVFSIGMCGPKA